MVHATDTATAEQQMHPARRHGLLGLLETWRERARTRQELTQMDWRMLADLGLTASAAAREASKPWWRA